MGKLLLGSRDFRTKSAELGAGDGPARYIGAMSHLFQHFIPPLTPWHITFGTYGTRLHGAAAPTVDKQHNERSEPFLSRNTERAASDRERMKFAPRYFDSDQRVFVEAELPMICERGGWHYRICAAGSDHVHLLCDADRVSMAKKSGDW